MGREQKAFLNRRLRDAVSTQPELKRLKALLLRLGGDFLVAPPRQDQDVPMLLERGFLTAGAITLRVMQSSSCHQNVASIWNKKKFGIVGIATGYALSGDGLWRQHSWGIVRDGVLETTETRLKYFGIVLQGEKADFFAFSNSTTPENPIVRQLSLFLRFSRCPLLKILLDFLQGIALEIRGIGI